MNKITPMLSHDLNEAGQNVMGLNPFLNQCCWTFGLSSGSAERREVTTQRKSWASSVCLHMTSITVQQS